MDWWSGSLYRYNASLIGYAVRTTLANHQQRAAYVTNYRLEHFSLAIAGLLAVGLCQKPAVQAQQAITQDDAATRISPPVATVAQPASLNAKDKLAELWVLPKEHHLWARFPIGSWREIEILTETFDEQGRVFGQSVTTQKETLKSVTEDGYVIDTQATVDIAGKRITGDANTRVLRLTTDRAGGVYSTTRRNNASMELAIGSADCQVWEVRYAEEGRNLLDRLHYSPTTFPHVLRREIFEESDSSSAEASARDVAIVTAQAVPFVWKGQVLECVEQQFIRRREKGNSQAIALVSSEIPGGEAQCQITDFDGSGRRIRWSVQKLVNFEVGPYGKTSEETTISRVSRAQGQE